MLSAGDFLLAPRGVPHTIRNTGSEDVRMLIMSTPAGFEDFVQAFGTPALTHELPVLEGPPDIGRAAALAAENGIDLLGPPGMLPPNCPKPSQQGDGQPARQRRGRHAERARPAQTRMSANQRALMLGVNTAECLLHELRDPAGSVLCARCERLS